MSTMKHKQTIDMKTKGKSRRITRKVFVIDVDGRDMHVPVPPGLNDPEKVMEYLKRALSGSYRAEEKEKYDKLVKAMMKGGDK